MGRDQGGPRLRRLASSHQSCSPHEASSWGSDRREHRVVANHLVHPWDEPIGGPRLRRLASSRQSRSPHEASSRGSCRRRHRVVATHLVRTSDEPPVASRLPANGILVGFPFPGSQGVTMETARLAPLDMALVAAYLLGVTGLGTLVVARYSDQPRLFPGREVTPLVGGRHVAGRFRHRGEGHDRPGGRRVPLWSGHDELRFHRLRFPGVGRRFPVHAVSLDGRCLHGAGVPRPALQRKACGCFSRSSGRFS